MVMKRRLLPVGYGIVWWLLSAGSLMAQIVPDQTLPVNSQVTTLGTRSTITGGTERGVNLYHSFREFSVPTGGAAIFNNASQIQIILTRVTGNSISSIDGLLKANGLANLYLLNPNGILFGPNARLEIGGSLFATTANSFKFSDSSEFSAVNPQAPPLLTVNLTPGLQMGTIAPGSTIVHRGNLSAGPDLTLVADILDLQGQLQAGKNVTLQAQNRVQIRDSSSTPFTGVAGNRLLIRGDRSVDIGILSHPGSGLWSGQDLVLQSGNPIVGDAHFYAGRNLQIEQLNGNPGKLFSPQDPVILAAANVSLGDYEGASLHILAGGSVTLGNVTINNPGEGTTTINPTNLTPVNSSRTLADLATVELTDYQASFNPDGSLQAVLPVVSKITIDGSSQATLDLRAGVDWAQLGGLPTSPTILGAVTPASEDGSTATRADITVTGTIRVNQPGGLMLLTNQFYPNNLEGTISPQGMDTSTTIVGANGGDIRLYGRGDITLAGRLSTSSYLYFEPGDSGNGGAISLAAAGAISLPNSPLDSSSYSSLGAAGQGGNISLSSYSGNISLLSSFFNSDSGALAGNSGQGGNISLVTHSGNILLSDVESETGFSVGSSLSSRSVTFGGDSAKGGDISLISYSGAISLIRATETGFLFLSGLSSNSLSATGLYSEPGTYSNNSGPGGNISLISHSGNISVEKYEQFDSGSASVSGSGSSAGHILLRTDSGSISLSTLSLLSGSYSSLSSEDAPSVQGISLISGSGDISLTDVYPSSSTVSGSGNAKDGGDILFKTGSGNISLTNSAINSTSSAGSGTAGQGGNISLISDSGNIFLSNYSELNSSSTSYSGNAGRGGDISLATPNGDIINSNSFLYSFALAQDSSQRSGDGGAVSLTAKNLINNLEIFTQTSTGTAGTVTMLGTGDLTLSHLQISTSQAVTVPIQGQLITFNPEQIGESGDVIIIGENNLTFDANLINSNTSGTGDAGNILIVSPGVVSFRNGTQLLSNTTATGNAGTITVNGGQEITLTGNSQITAQTSGQGTAGDIILNTPNLIVAGDAQILAETSDRGAGGTITINAPGAVSFTRILDASPVLSVEARGAGQAGNILINTPTLTLSDQARITATATATATNPQGGGSITLNASDLFLAGVVGVFAETQGQSPAGTLRLNPYANQADLSIALTPNSQISASTSGSGRGGDLIVSAPRSITIAGPGKLSVETTGSGDAGDMRFTTQQLTLKDGVNLSASTSGSGRAGTIQLAADTINLLERSIVSSNTSGFGEGGTITVEGRSLNALGGAQLTTSTSGSGKAGDIIVNLRDRLLLSGVNTQFFAGTESGSTGNGGSILIDPQRVDVRDGASIAVSSKGSGIGGNITLQAGRLALLNQGSIAAETASSQGGNIFLTIRDYLLMRHNSLISATAGTAQAGGNGGNITINSPFILGILQENSDITANAFTGSGGRVTINTQGIFGLKYQPRLTPNSDITASSQFGLSGIVTISAPNVDPAQGAIALPTTLVDPSRQIAQGCNPGGRLADRNNRFTIVGRGGTSASPTDAFTGEQALVQVMDAIPTTAQQQDDQPVNTSQAFRPTPIVEAQTWSHNQDGSLSLVAASNYALSPDPAFPTLACAKN